MKKFFLSSFITLFCASLVGAQSNVPLMPTVTLTTAVTGVTFDPYVMQSADVPTAVHLQARFTYGSGGTTAKAWVQTSFDGGTTWTDIACFAFTTASERVIHSVRYQTAVGANYVATDGTLADDTIKDGLIGDRLRVKITTTGTYGGSTTLEVRATIVR